MKLAVRYTIERTTTAPFRRPDGREPSRFLGHDNDGSLVWLQSFRAANTFFTRQDADSLRRNRLRNSAESTVVRHTVH